MCSSTRRYCLTSCYLNDEPVLHIVDEGTKFSVARFLPSIYTDAVWEKLSKCWASVYTGLLNKILTDEGSQLGDRFIRTGKLAEVGVSQTVVEAHFSLGLVERYHGSLNSIFRNIKIFSPGCG